jgi:transcription initiation factor IIF auxiliary subunit
MDLEVKQNVTPHDQGGWDWSIWLDGPAEDLDEIKYVEYILHPTFSPPMRKISNRSTNFRLDARGWGEFNIKIRVHTDEGDDDMFVMEHWLELDETAPTKEAESFRFRSVTRSVEHPRLYLSSAIADIEFVYQLKEALQNDGVDVLLKQDIDYEQSLKSLLETQRRSIQGGIFVISDVRNPWLVRDYWTLEQHKISLMVVQIGESRELPDEMESLPRFQIKDVSETDTVAASIARRVRDQI